LLIYLYYRSPAKVVKNFNVSQGVKKYYYKKSPKWGRFYIKNIFYLHVFFRLPPYKIPNINPTIKTNKTMTHRSLHTKCAASENTKMDLYNASL
jgi:hypothetical protein